jgi:hypothetical protein
LNYIWRGVVFAVGTLRLQKLRDRENNAQEPQAAPSKGIEDEDYYD